MMNMIRLRRILANSIVISEFFAADVNIIESKLGDIYTSRHTHILRHTDTQTHTQGGKVVSSVPCPPSGRHMAMRSGIV